MIYSTASVKSLVTETFIRRVKEDNSERDMPCIRLKSGISRTLALSRYVQLEDAAECKPQKDDRRRLTAIGIKDGTVKTTEKLKSWRGFAISLAGEQGENSPRLLFARQVSRLLVGMAGGVFENGSLTLDRLSGLPVIPGSAVKGCARRLALAALEEWTSGQLQAGEAENLLAPAIEGFQTPEDMLVEIALIFGWSDLEWQGREDFDTDKKWEEKRPDFAWACGEQWHVIRKAVSARFCSHFGITPKEADRPWESLPHFAGTISFLPASPWQQDPGIDLDVITCHHGIYYSTEPNRQRSPDKWREWQAHRDAPDTEEPVPVIFPAIAPGQTWVFLLHPTLRAEAAHLTHARRWLALALETFGIGAKTNAGYGWFEVPELAEMHRLREEQAEQRRQQEVAARAQKEQKERDAANAHLLAISPDLALLERFSELKPDQLRAAINKFQFDDTFWPKPPAEEATDIYQVSLLIFLTETQRSLYDEEKAKPKSKVLLALQKLAAKYARNLPE